MFLLTQTITLMQLKFVEMKSAVDLNDNDQIMRTIAVYLRESEGITISEICKQDRESMYNYTDHYDMLSLISMGSWSIISPKIPTE